MRASSRLSLAGGATHTPVRPTVRRAPARGVPRWIGWLGIVVAVFAGWLGLLARHRAAIEGITFLGFIAFFVFMLSMGTALLLRQRRALTA